MQVFMQLSQIMQFLAALSLSGPSCKGACSASGAVHTVITDSLDCEQPKPAAGAAQVLHGVTH
jgi:hypothetical protein